MDKFIADNSLSDTFADLDNIAICGKNKAEPDANLQRFLEAAERSGLTLNFDKCSFSVSSVTLLG